MLFLKASGCRPSAPHRQVRCERDSYDQNSAERHHHRVIAHVTGLNHAQSSAKLHRKPANAIHCAIDKSCIDALPQHHTHFASTFHTRIYNRRVITELIRRGTTERVPFSEVPT